MSNNSFAVQAVANGPMTVAPPSFDGHGWLVAINLAWMTTAAILALMLVGKLVKDMIRHKERDGWPAPAFIFRLIGVVGATGIAMRCGVEAMSLWGWDPLEPVTTAWFLIAKRLTDPLAISFGLVFLTLYTLSEPAMIEQLRKEPFPLRMWPRLRLLKRPAAIAFLALVASVGVVSTR
ncbi:hypothetical protein GGQ80_002105 [Sphingomonas jinjuensis]|uniref:Uncharacterized protein n=1 Tax=Sphingomonas jinjuensis TaxID=535907 RepID=A0A840FLK5_9SPHN|nr:hypothetical protein [Sphingomonas jinjuensis]MBB4154195.1 hypothetical protein [Sphingomonas jinjuensis]